MQNHFRRIRRILKGKESRNTLWILAERIASISIATGVTIMSARFLGAENYGLLSYGLSLIAFFTGIMKLGLDTTMVNEILDKPEKAGHLIGTSIVMRLSSSFLSISSIFLLVLVLNGESPLLLSIVFLQSLVLVFQAFNVIDFWFQSQLQSKYVSIAKIIASLSMGIYSAFLLLAGKDVRWFAFSTTLSSLVVAVILAGAFLKTGQRFRVSFPLSKELLSRSHHFIFTSVIVAVYVQIDKVMIANILNEEELGFYAAALLISSTWIFLPESIIISARPRLIDGRRSLGEEFFLLKLKDLYFQLFWLSVFISIFICLSASILIKILYGNEYLDSIPVIQIYVWSIPFAVLGTARGIWIVAEGKGKYSKYHLGLGVLINVLLNLVLIPRLGIAGAALATVLTEICTCFITPLITKATRPHPKLVVQAILKLR